MASGTKVDRNMHVPLYATVMIYSLSYDHKDYVLSDTSAKYHVTLMNLGCIWQLFIPAPRLSCLRFPSTVLLKIIESP